MKILMVRDTNVFIHQMMKKMFLAVAAIFASMVGLIVFSPKTEAAVAYFSYQGYTA